MPFIFMVTIITPIIVVFVFIVSFIIVSPVITSVAVSSVVVSTVLIISVYIVPVIVGNLLSLIINLLSLIINKSVVLRMISYHKIFLITTVPYNGLLSSPVTTILISVISIS